MQKTFVFGNGEIVSSTEILKTFILAFKVTMEGTIVTMTTFAQQGQGFHLGGQLPTDERLPKLIRPER